MSNSVLSVGSKFPVFNKKSVVNLEMGKEFKLISSEEHKENKKWMIMFWYPKDFTFVCPTEIAEFNNNYEEFAKRNTVLYGASTDSEYVHLAWRRDAQELRNLKFPLIADTSKSLATDLGILTAEEKVAYRATYIVDPEGTIQWVCVNSLNVGRNVAEILRVLDALQVGGLMPCNWKPGDKTL